MTREKIFRRPSTAIALIAITLAAGCENGSIASLAGKPPALCSELLGEPARSVTAGVLADDEALEGEGSALVPWDRFLDGFEAGCKA